MVATVDAFEVMLALNVSVANWVALVVKFFGVSTTTMDDNELSSLTVLEATHQG